VEFWRDAGGVRRMRRNLVLTPSAGAYLLVIAYGAVRAPLRHLLEFLHALLRF
jgi:hypothetical protein